MVFFQLLLVCLLSRRKTRRRRAQDEHRLATRAYLKPTLPGEKPTKDKGLLCTRARMMPSIEKNYKA